ncbi:pentapeptide repeat-containing protein [Roseinatronobacter alkalisoli]|uniref:Pentapeptide repeat-containing protein n=1 Tax=Roseinatronobacter alkalisoli TaxID=3028235 RepID=A0ABT5T621_9RHOB|nr:pentapeptide repeat-containing protein [Roseinatronobacter sp. HJB301]MDD7970560.1 pentapeptide repeat-containing protein [Roseinatronobacter sp. HJB301]
MTKDTRPNATLTDWLGVSDDPNWRVARPLGPLLTVVVAVLFVLALVSAFVVLGRTIFAGGEVSLGVGGLVVALLGAPFVIWGTVLKHQTVMFQKEGHMTDRINKAVEQLGAEKVVKKIIDGETQETSEPNIEVRIGAILSLERIAQDSTRHDKGRDHVRVMEILCAYIKENAPIKDKDEEKRSSLTKAFAENSAKADYAGPDFYDFALHWAGNSPKPRADIELALRVIGRRTGSQIAIEENHPAPDGRYKLDLSDADLRRVDLTGLDFSDANMRGSWLDSALLNGVKFDRANLLYTYFYCASAAETSFVRANLGADFTGAILDRSTFEFFKDDDPSSRFTSYDAGIAGFQYAQLIDAHIKFRGNPRKRTTFIGSQFSGAIMRGSLFDGFSHFHECRWPDLFHDGDKGEKGLAFRNCHLTAEIEDRCTLELCFGDGSVTLADGSGPDGSNWPAHWPKAKLGDIEFNNLLEEWRRLRN